MSTVDWDELRALFEEGRSLQGLERERFVDSHCAHDDALRVELVSLLDAEIDSVDFLTPPSPAEIAEHITQEEFEWKPGHTIGRYEIIRPLALGGMAAVYLARRADQHFEKTVAIKVIRRGLVNRIMRRRFIQERQTLARLEHPNICRLLDADATHDGVPYLIMEYIDGTSITSYCQQHDLSVTERVHLFLSLCDAVQYAHRNLVIHRDIKPSNILVDTEGQAKLLDFGIAHMLSPNDEESYLLTTTSAMVTQGSGKYALTPLYASPEQVRGEAVTTASDVYSLGVVLYELVSGMHPFQSYTHSRFKAEKAICEVEPIAPSRAHTKTNRNRESGVTSLPTDRLSNNTPPRIESDLDVIILKSLQKDPARRYDSVEQLAEDIRRFSEQRPILARPDSVVYILRKYIARNRLFSAAAAVASVAIATAIIVIVMSGMQLRESEHTATVARDDAVESLAFFENLLTSANPYRRGHDVSVKDILLDATELVENRLNDKPRVEANVRLAIGRTWVEIYDWAAAVPHLRKAVEYYRSHPTPDHELAQADAMCLLAIAENEATYDTGARNTPGIIAMARESLEIRRRLLGPSHIAIAQSLSAVATVEQGNIADQEDVRRIRATFEEALEMFDANANSPSLLAAQTACMIGFFELQNGSAPASEEAFLNAIARFDECKVPADRYLTSSLVSLARVNLARGDVDEAQQFLAFRGDADRPQSEPTWEERTGAVIQAQIHTLQDRPLEAMRELALAVRLECEHIRLHRTHDKDALAAIQDSVTVVDVGSPDLVVNLINACNHLSKVYANDQPRWGYNLFEILGDAMLISERWEESRSAYEASLDRLVGAPERYKLVATNIERKLDEVHVTLHSPSGL